MAADVSFVFQVRSNKSGEQDEKAAVPLVTRDLLGGCSKESGLDMNLPSPWQKRTADLVSVENFPHRNCPVSVGESNKVHDLNFPPPSSLRVPGDIRSFHAGTVDLSLNLPPASPHIQNQSVCTLEKVRFALERAAGNPKRLQSTPSPASSGRSGDSSGPVDSRWAGLMIAAGCPNCLLYVLISGRNPKCPRCDAVVPLPSASPASSAAKKKPRLDLNSSSPI